MHSYDILRYIEPIEDENVSLLFTGKSGSTRHEWRVADSAVGSFLGSRVCIYCLQTTTSFVGLVTATKRDIM